MNYWLMKSEPDAFSIDNLKSKKKNLDGMELEIIRPETSCGMT